MLARDVFVCWHECNWHLKEFRKGTAALLLSEELVTGKQGVNILLFNALKDMGHVGMIQAVVQVPKPNDVGMVEDVKVWD